MKTEIESWFNCPERIARLEFHAASWEGTPWLPNSNTKGPRGGVSCQKLVAELYREAGFAEALDVGKEIPNVAMCHAVFAHKDESGEARSLLVPWMDARRDFAKILLAEGHQLDGGLAFMRIGDAAGQQIGVIGEDVTAFATARDGDVKLFAINGGERTGGRHEQDVIDSFAL